MLNKLATARAMGFRAFHTGKWLEDNPFIEPQLRQAWQIAWVAENYKHVERITQRERQDDEE
jgi:hypothetical protein